MAQLSFNAALKMNALGNKAIHDPTNCRAKSEGQMMWVCSKSGRTRVKMSRGSGGPGPVVMMSSSTGTSKVVSETSSTIVDDIPRLSANYHGDLWHHNVIQTLETPFRESSTFQERADELVVKIKDMFNALGDGDISPSAYDTAWVARVATVSSDGSEKPRFPQALNWVLNNQLQDGSWGIESHFSLCDRLLNTVNSVIALSVWKTGHSQVEQGTEFIAENLRLLNEEDELSPDFEIIFPALLQKAKALGINLPYDLPFIKSLSTTREARLTDVSAVADNIPANMLNALEGLEEVIDWNKIMRFQSKDGSFLSSPASTACVLMNTGDEKCFTLLNNLLDKFGGCVPCMYSIDLLERLSLVDNIEHLGIGRHFKQEIKVALDYVYRHWSERGIGWGRDSLVPDLNTTALGLRTLRTHGYDVSSDVLNNFKDENGRFFSSAGQTHVELRSVVNLFRASDLAFPDEGAMDDARKFAEPYLRDALATKISTNTKLYKEIEYVVEYPWHMSIPRLEARSYIDSYDDDYVWQRKTLYRMPSLSNSKCLELAKLDFNIVQSLHQEELKLLTRWWKESGMADINFTRHRVAEVYFSSATFEPEYSATRIAFTKIGCLQVLFDDMADIFATLDELKSFTEGVKRWDTSLLHEIPECMQTCFKVWFKLMEEVNNDVVKVQGRDMLAHIRKPWELYFNCYVQEREWLEAGYIPTFEEYLKTYAISVGLGPCTLQPILLMGELVKDDVVEKVHYPSNMFELVSLSWRLTNDTKTYQAEKARGQQASGIACYMKDNPGATEEDAIKHICRVVDRALKEASFEYFKPSNDIPMGCKSFIFNLRLCVQIFYKFIDGYGIANEEIKDYIRKVYIDPIQV
uniref:Taxadiene synthase n=2 Tax=Taxus TaxID=25628 RepID=Q6SA60_9CONI|nr:taxadiene synthase [Taxus x media]